MSSKILIVDDEKGIVIMLKNYFLSQGYQVYCAYDGLEALKKMSHHPDIILLDINMPKMDGLTVCQRIRHHTSCPIIFLTAQIGTENKIKGFDVGGDDYIEKPFDLDELNARVQAHLRREHRKQEQTVSHFYGDMTINYIKRQVSINDSIIALPRKAFDILELLSTNAGQVFDKERIYEAVWGLEGDGSSDTVMEHIRRIRKSLESLSTHDYIETVWGVGYKWNG
jgi:DNA-binding response OmpR family regulator